VDVNEQESACQSFIVKVWSEGADGKGKSLGWRSHITHVPSGERRYTKDLSEISSVIEAYLKDAGTLVTRESWVVRWLKRLRKRF
jgi:hypothetical protein